MTAVGDDTTLAGIRRMVADAQASGSRTQALAERFAALLFYVATGSAAVTFVVWWSLGDLDAAVTKTVTVLVIACPHALGLAIPLVISISTAVSARAGILVKDRRALERMRSIDAVLFDKTGTLTLGAHVVTDVAGAGGFSASEVLRIAGAVESDSEHPLARAVTTLASEEGPLPDSRDFRSRTGRGAEATVDDTRYAVGGPALLREADSDVPSELGTSIDTWERRGATVLHLLEDGRVIGALALEDEVRPEAREAVESAGVVLASSDPRGVTAVIRLSRATYRKMVQNLAWAAGYNVVAIPLAAGALAWAGVDLSPAVGAILMSLSTIVVALNAQLQRRVGLQPPVEPGEVARS